MKFCVIKLIITVMSLFATGKFLAETALYEGKGDECRILPVFENPMFTGRLWKIPIDPSAHLEIARSLEKYGYTGKQLVSSFDPMIWKTECDKILEECKIWQVRLHCPIAKCSVSWQL